MIEDNTILTYKLANPEKLDCFNSYLLPSNIGVEGPPIRRIRLPPAIAAYFRRLANARILNGGTRWTTTQYLITSLLIQQG